MKTLHYVDQHVVTGDEIATSVLEYAGALALAGRSDVLDVPALDDESQPATYEFLIGPASQIIASDADPFPGGELFDQQFVADVRSRMSALSDHAHSEDEAAYLNADAEDEIFRESL